MEDLSASGGFNWSETQKNRKWVIFLEVGVGLFVEAEGEVYPKSNVFFNLLILLLVRIFCRENRG